LLRRNGEGQACEIDGPGHDVRARLSRAACPACSDRPVSLAD